MASVDLVDYCRPFVGWNSEWPSFPLKDDPQIEWWRSWLDLTTPDCCWSQLQENLPQLLIPPVKDACKGDLYKRLVLQGSKPYLADFEAGLREPIDFDVNIKSHWSGSMPIIHIRNQGEFTQLLQCLAHRCEPTPIQQSVHSQVIGGLIHWGLIRSIDPSLRCKILVLHHSPYSSIPFHSVPGMDSANEWLRRSDIWRLEHELIHVACKRLVGEMRLNLYDELLADAIAMRVSLGYFDSKLFRITMGLDPDGYALESSRVHTYTKGLCNDNKIKAQKLVLERAFELDELLSSSINGIDDIQLLKILVSNQLDRKLQLP